MHLKDNQRNGNENAIIPSNDCCCPQSEKTQHLTYVVCPMLVLLSPVNTFELCFFFFSRFLKQKFTWNWHMKPSGQALGHSCSTISTFVFFSLVVPLQRPFAPLNFSAIPISHQNHFYSVVARFFFFFFYTKVFAGGFFRHYNNTILLLENHKCVSVQ